MAMEALLVLAAISIPFIVSFIFAIWVYRDAKQRGIDYPGVWAIAVFASWTAATIPYHSYYLEGDEEESKLKSLILDLDAKAALIPYGLFVIIIGVYFGWYQSFLLVFWTIPVAVGVWVYKDANERNFDNPLIWAWFSAGGWFFIFPLYLRKRKRHPKSENNDN
jgi:hypothetical protein